MNRKSRKINHILSFSGICLLVIILAVSGVLFINGSGNEDAESLAAETTSVSAETDSFFSLEETETAEETTLSEEELLETEIREIIDSMNLEEKIAQLFVVTPEAITGVSCVTIAGDISKESINTWPVGGLIFFEKNLVSTEQVQAMLSGFQTYSEERTGLPLFLCVDEEGGTVARVAGNESFDVEDVGDMADIGASGDTQNAYDAGVTIGTYLSALGFNVDFAPVADVWSNPENTVVKYRSFGSDADLVAEMAASLLEGLESCGVYGTYKHFPGHGDTTGDTHDGYSYSAKTLEELYECEFIPFIEGIENGVSFIMAAHISLPNVTGDDTPASMSGTILGILRNDLDYEGIIITDALNMEAITETYTSAEAAVAALEAGADILLMPEDFESAFYGVLEAVENGTITEERIDESLERIIRVKLEM